MLLEIALLAGVLILGVIIVAYDLTLYRSRRQKIQEDTPVADTPTADRLRLEGALKKAGGTTAGTSVASARPLDAWVDDALRRKLDEL